MAQPIYSVFLMKPTEAWYQLSAEEQQKLMDGITQSLNKVGAESIVTCDSSWSTEPWQFFGLIRFPSIEAVQKHREDTNQMNWARYVEAMSFLGTEWQPPA